MERVVRTEHHLTNARMHPVSAENQVERSAAVPAEGDVDTVAVVVEGIDRVGEDELYVVADHREQRCACRKLHPCWSDCVVVFVEDAAQPL